MAPALRPVLVLAGLVSALLVETSAARACATCRVGDPTLTVLGTARPFEGRLRTGLTARHRTAAVGEPGVNALEISEQRLTASVAFSPTPRLTLAAALPLVRRHVGWPNLAEESVVAPGDLSIEGALLAWQDTRFAPTHTLSVRLGAELPTSPWREGSNGAPLPLERQTGGGVVAPGASVGYGLFADPWSAQATVALRWPAYERGGSKPGTSLQTGLFGQHQPLESLALRLGAELTHEGQAREEGAADPDAGGTILFVAPGLVWSPLTDLLVHLTVHLPTVDALTGQHDEGPVFDLEVAVDW